MKGTAASCTECSKLRPDDSFTAICGRCLDKLSGPKDPEGDLAQILAQEAEDRKILEEVTARLHHREVAKHELQRRLAADFVEEFFGELDDFVAMFLSEGHVHQKYTSLQSLWGKIKENDEQWPGSLSADEYDSLLDRTDPEKAYLTDAVRNGSFGEEAKLAVTLQRIFKNKSDSNPVWKEK